MRSFISMIVLTKIELQSSVFFLIVHVHRFDRKSHGAVIKTSFIFF